MRIRYISLLAVVACSAEGSALPNPAATPHDVIAHYDHLPTQNDIALIAETGGTNLVVIRLANCVWFQTTIENTNVFNTLAGVQASRADTGTNHTEPVYVFYAGGATAADSAILDSLSSGTHGPVFLSDSVLGSVMRLDNIDRLARDLRVSSVSIVSFVHPI